MKFKRVYQIEEGSTFILSRGCSRLGQGSKRERWIAILDFLLKW
jgi:hypothetical protein